MPGLFGGSGDQTNGAPTNVPITAIAPPWMKNMKNVTTSAPGQVNQLARQMAAGGFGSAVPDYEWLKSFYNPTAASPKPTPKVVPKVPVPKVPPVGPSAHPYVSLGGRNAR